MLNRSPHFIISDFDHPLFRYSASLLISRIPRYFVIFEVCTMKKKMGVFRGVILYYTEPSRLFEFGVATSRTCRLRSKIAILEDATSDSQKWQGSGQSWGSCMPIWQPLASVPPKPHRTIKPSKATFWTYWTFQISRTFWPPELPGLYIPPGKLWTP